MTSTTSTTYEFRRCGPQDLGIVLRAQEASIHEIDMPPTEEEVCQALMDGRMEAYILIGERSKMTVTVRRDAWCAMLIAFYREGPAQGLWAETQLAWSKLVDVLQSGGITQIVADISRKNKRFEKLLRLYFRLQFEPHSVRLVRRI